MITTGSKFLYGLGSATAVAAILWFIAGSAYLIGLLIIHVLVPRMEPVKMEDIAEAEAK